MLRQKKNALVHALDMEVKVFVFRHLGCFDARLEPYMPYYNAMEVIDPLLCSSAFEEALEGEPVKPLEDICKRFGVRADKLTSEIIELRSASVAFSNEQREQASTNFALLVIFDFK